MSAHRSTPVNRNELGDLQGLTLTGNSSLAGGDARVRSEIPASAATRVTNSLGLIGSFPDALLNAPCEALYQGALIMTHRDDLLRFSASGLYQLNCTPMIAFPVFSAGGEAPAMRGHRQAFPTPRGDGKSDPKGDVARLPDVVAGRVGWTHTTARRASSRKPRNAVVGVQFS